MKAPLIILQAIIAINANNPLAKPEDRFEAMQIRVKEKGFTCPYLLDEGQYVYHKCEATKTPHIFVLQKTKQGNVVTYIGVIDNNYKDASAIKTKCLKKAVDALLKGKEIKKKKPKRLVAQ